MERETRWPDASLLSPGHPPESRKVAVTSQPRPARPPRGWHPDRQGATSPRAPPARTAVQGKGQVRLHPPGVSTPLPAVWVTLWLSQDWKGPRPAGWGTPSPGQGEEGCLPGLTRTHAAPIQTRTGSSGLDRTEWSGAGHLPWEPQVWATSKLGSFLLGSCYCGTGVSRFPSTGVASGRTGAPLRTLGAFYVLGCAAPHTGC